MCRYFNIILLKDIYNLRKYFLEFSVYFCLSLQTMEHVTYMPKEAKRQQEKQWLLKTVLFGYNCLIFVSHLMLVNINSLFITLFYVRFCLISLLFRSFSHCGQVGLSHERTLQILGASFS